jgi:hypothetical protein
MEKTLQEQYNLIKEGKGNKAYFLKSAYRLFPDVLSQVNSFEDTTRILKNRGVINEGIGGVVTTGRKQDWHAIFNENMDNLRKDEEADFDKVFDEYVKNHSSHNNVRKKYSLIEDDIKNNFGLSIKKKNLSDFYNIADKYYKNFKQIRKKINDFKNIFFYN